jgi:hypothetical protein
MSWLRTISLRPTANQITLGRDQLYAIVSSCNRLQSLDITMVGLAVIIRSVTGVTLRRPRVVVIRGLRCLRRGVSVDGNSGACDLNTTRRKALRLRAFRADDLLAITNFRDAVSVAAATFRARGDTLVANRVQVGGARRLAVSTVNRICHEPG